MPKLDPVVPDECLEADTATIAQKGAGKTYLNRGLVERLLDKKRRAIILDPLGHWWGITARPDGSAGYPVAVIGGKHAHIPLDPTRGEELGAYLGAGAISAVIDVSELRRGEMYRFATAFLSELYRVNEEALWLVLEEADVFAPQQPMGDQTFTLSIVDTIARRGRARGFRLWSMTQRPAKLAKDVLTQVSTLFLLRLRAPQDRAAAEDWIKGHAEKARAAEIISSLASLPVGSGYVWAPDLDLLKLVQFPTIKTLDTSATPKAGDPKLIVGKSAKPDLSALAALMAPGIEEPEAKPVSRNKEAIAKIVIDKAVADAKAEGVKEGFLRGFSVAQAMVGAALGKMREAGDDFLADLEMAKFADGGSVPKGSGEVSVFGGPREIVLPRNSEPTKKLLFGGGGSGPGTTVTIDTGGAGIGGGGPGMAITIDAKGPAERDALAKPLRKIIDSCLWWHRRGFANPTRQQVAFLAGYKVNSGTWDTYQSRLRAAGLITIAPGVMCLTAEGVGLAVATPINSAAELHATIRALLAGPEAKFFDVLLAAYPNPISRGDWAERAGYTPQSGTSDTYRSRVSSLGLAEKSGQGFVIAPLWLFPGDPT